MNFFKRFFGGRRHKPTPPKEQPEPAPTRERVTEEFASPAVAKLFGHPEEDTPMVMVPMGSAMMIMDRLSFEYQRGQAKGTDPSQAELDAVLAKVDRLRVLAGGMMRDQPLGTDVLLDIRNRAEINALREALRIEENPETFSHCGCLGGPTAECYTGRGLVATLSFHHGHGLRWSRWKHDAKLAEPASLLKWFTRHGIEPDPIKKSDDAIQLQLLALKDAERLAYRASRTWSAANCTRHSMTAARPWRPTPIVPSRTACGRWSTAPGSGPTSARRTATRRCDWGSSTRRFVRPPWLGMRKANSSRPRPTATPRWYLRQGTPESTTAAA